MMAHEPIPYELSDSGADPDDAWSAVPVDSTTRKCCFGIGRHTRACTVDALARVNWTDDGGIQITTREGTISVDLQTAAAVAATIIRRVVDTKPEIFFFSGLNVDDVIELDSLAGDIIYGRRR